MKKKVLQIIALVSIVALPAIGWATVSAATATDGDCPCSSSCPLSSLFN